MAAEKEYWMCCSTLESKALPMDKIIVDHVKRILEDHDYVKCLSRDGEITSERSCDGSTSLVQQGQLKEQDFMDTAVSVNGDVLCTTSTKKDEKRQVSNEGIQASNLSSLLQQFLDYEQAITKETSLLTPATSPGHHENFQNEHADIKQIPASELPELTPPGTPPIFQVHVNGGNNDGGNEQKVDIEMGNSSAVGQKRKIEEDKCINVEKCVPVLLGDDKVQSGAVDCFAEQESGKHLEKKKRKKQIQEDARSKLTKSEKKSSHVREMKHDSCARDEKEQRKRKRRCRKRHSSSSNDESSDNERYNPRVCEKDHEYVRRKPSRSKYDHSKNRQYSTSQGCLKSDSSSRHKSRHSHREHERKYRLKNFPDVEQQRKIDFRLGRSSITDSAKEERRVVYVGGLPYGTTRDELWNRFRHFGHVEKVTVHLREGERDNYGFVTFSEPDDARHCIERGNCNPTEHLDLCFGGRRQYCGGSYVDFDSKTSHIEELTEIYGNIRSELPEEDDFDTLLRKCQHLQRAGGDSRSSP